MSTNNQNNYKLNIDINSEDVLDAIKSITTQMLDAQNVANSILLKGVTPALNKMELQLTKIATHIEKLNSLNKISLQNYTERIESEQQLQQQVTVTQRAIEKKTVVETQANKKAIEELQTQEEHRQALIEAGNEKIKNAGQSAIEINKEYIKSLKDAMDKAKELGKNFENGEYKEYIDGLNKAPIIKDGVGIIDEKSTRENLEKIGNYYQKYKEQIEKSINTTAKYYDKAISAAQAEGKDFSELQKNKEEDLNKLDLKFQTVNKAITDNTRQQTDLMVNTWKSAMDNVTKIAEGVMQGVNSIFGVMNQNFKIEIEAAKQDLASATKEIENQNKIITAADEERKAYYAEIEIWRNRQYELENELAANSASYTDKERERREKDLQDYKNNIDKKLETEEEFNAGIDIKRKEAEESKKNAEKKKKDAEEKQKRVEARQKKAEIAQQIIKATADVASGVAKALSYGPILGPVLAAVVGAAGAVQVGIIASQLNRIKMEKGGLLNGKRHSEGGMRIEGTNIEVEGGEYVVNRRSTSKNLGLISYINSQNKELQAGDLSKFFAQRPAFMPTNMQRMMEEGGQIPQIEKPSGIDSEILDAIKAIDMQPRVAVTDIIRAQDQYASVENWSGV